MKKPTAVIIKSSPWKSAQLYRNHPEYMAIFNTVQRYGQRVDFILVGTSNNHTTASLAGNGAIAWDIERKGTLGHLKYDLELTMILLRYRPHLTIVLGNLQILPVAIFSLLSLRSKYVPIFIGEFTYYGRNTVGRIFHTLFFKALSVVLRLSKENIAGMFTLSKFERDGITQLAPCLKGRIRLISYPISHLFCVPKKKTIPADATPPIILTVAGLEPRKGLDTLIEAVSLIPRKVQVIIKGARADAIYTQKLKGMVKDLRLEDTIRFVTEVIDYDALVSYYESATLFVFPTREDCLGVVLLEALCNSLPVIATCVGGIPDMIKNGENGLLVKPNDSPGLARAILLLLNDNAVREKLAGNAKKVLLNQYYKGRITLEEALDQSIANLASSAD
jgi:glycosyltransferase involved in cell wall biosynthesis